MKWLLLLFFTISIFNSTPQPKLVENKDIVSTIPDMQQIRELRIKIERMRRPTRFYYKRHLA